MKQTHPRSRSLTAALLAALLLLALPLPAMASWGQINQDLARPEDWQRIVTESGFALGGLNPPDAEGGPAVQDFGGYPSIDGSTVSVPMAIEFARQHLDLSEGDLPGFVSFSTTHSAYLNLIHKQPNTASVLPYQDAVMDPSRAVEIMIGTGPSDEELQTASDAGVALKLIPVCYDAFVFIVNTENPVDGLTVAQIRDIFSGATRNWSALGGNDEWINAYVRQKNSGSQTAMDDLVMQGTPMSASLYDYNAIEEMSALVERIGAYDNARRSIGYTYLYYIDALYRDEGVKTLAIDGIPPTPENIRSGAYPFTTMYYAVIREEDQDATAGRFAEWIISEEGQRCVKQAGYIPITDPDAAE